MMIRRCSVAGMFYPSDPVQLMKMIEMFFQNVSSHEEAMGIVSPHAGYVYSGQTAAEAFAAIRPDFEGTFIVIGPSHQGFQTCISTMAWETPIGQIEPDLDLLKRINLKVDDVAFSMGNENSLEVQMPLIKYRYPNAKIAPVMMGHQTLEEVARIAVALKSALDGYQTQIKIVASSDFSHYVPHDKARSDDMFAIEALKTLDIVEFISRIKDYGITACGYGPIASMIETLKGQGVKCCELLSYTTSGETSGDLHQVVGYAALAVR